MDSRTILWLVVAIVVIGGGIWYWSGSDTTTPQEAAEENGDTTSDTVAGDTTNGSGSIAALMALSGSYECTVTVPSTNPPSTGTVQVSGGKMRGEFTVVADGRTIQAFMVNDGAYIYSWSDMAPQGVKFSAQAATGGTRQSGGVDVNTNVSYNCRPWTADASVFVPPTSVTFMTV